jgi:hypothetical protein
MAGFLETIGIFEFFLLVIFVMGALSGLSCLVAGIIHWSERCREDILDDEPLPLYRPPSIKPPDYAVIFE